MAELEVGKVYVDADGDRWIVVDEPDLVWDRGGYFWRWDREAFEATADYMTADGQKYGPFTLADSQPLPRTLEEHAAAIQVAINAAADDGYWLDDGDASTPILDLNGYPDGSPMRWVSLEVPERR